MFLKANKTESRVHYSQSLLMCRIKKGSMDKIYTVFQEEPSHLKQLNPTLWGSLIFFFLH